MHQNVNQQYGSQGGHHHGVASSCTWSHKCTYTRAHTHTHIQTYLYTQARRSLSPHHSSTIVSSLFVCTISTASSSAPSGTHQQVHQQHGLQGGHRHGVASSCTWSHKRTYTRTHAHTHTNIFIHTSTQIALFTSLFTNYFIFVCLHHLYSVFKCAVRHAPAGPPAAWFAGRPSSRDGSIMYVLTFSQR